MDKTEPLPILTPLDFWHGSIGRIGETCEVELDPKAVLEQRFAARHGVVALSANMTDEQILNLIKAACTWSEGKSLRT